MEGSTDCDEEGRSLQRVQGRARYVFVMWEGLHGGSGEGEQP